jgi:hypothetical protein
MSLMTQIAILWPMCALAALTFVVLLVVPYQRFTAAFAGKVRSEDFLFGESVQVPPEVGIANRNYMNLLEIPVLFYVVCLALFAARLADPFDVRLAWIYVALRALHSIVHLTYNNVFHRMTLFAASNVVLLLLWVRLMSGL